MLGKKTELPKAADKIDPAAAATLAGVIYQAKLINRQAKVNVPEKEVVAEVLGLWRSVMNAINSEAERGVRG